MTTRFRRPMLVLGTTILIMQAVLMPVGTVYAETTMDTEEQELMELPPMKNYMEEEQISDPRFFFTRSRMQGTAEDPLQVTFFSDQEVSEARVLLPEEATLLKDQLPIGISVEEGAQPNEWIVQSKRAQHTFVLPLVVEQVGNYELTVEETTAHLEISEKEETSEEVPVEETESSENDPTGQEELKEENEIEENKENEQPVEEAREPVSEAPQEQQTDEEETDEVSQVVEPTVFDGETAEVTTMAEFREAVANPAIGIISVQANLTEATANVLTVNRPLLIQGNGYTLTFGHNGFYFQLEEVTQASTLRIENATLTKAGTTPLINSTVENSKNWTVELEDVTEVNANALRLASLPEGSIHFTGGVSNFTRTNSQQTFIEAKEVLATNQAEVTIGRGNATVFFSSATADPKITVEQGATVRITTTAGAANTIDLRGESPELVLQASGQLNVTTAGTTAAPTDTTNNTIALIGPTPKITMNSGAKLTVSSTLAKRGVHLAGESPKLILDFSSVNITSTSGQRINLIGANPLISISKTELTMNSSAGGRGIYLQGETPQVLMENSQLLMTDTGASQGMILQGTDALLSLNNQSELAITGAGIGMSENIQIGSSNERPELSITGESKVSVTTTSGTGAATDTANNAIHLRGSDPKATVTGGSELVVSITSNARRGVYLNGNNANLSVSDSLLDVTTVSGQTINLTGTSPKMTLNKSNARVASTTGASMTLSGSDAVLEANESELAIQSTTGQRINLTGSNPVLNLKNSQLDMKATTGRGIYLQGAMPQVILDGSELFITDTDASQGMILHGTDALLSLSNESEFILTGAGSGVVENILIGNNQARPELLVTDGSKLSVTTSSGTTSLPNLAASTTNNAINVRGTESKTTILNGSELNILVTSNSRRGLTSQGAKSELLICDSLVNISTVAGHAIFTNNDDQKVLIRGSQTRVDLNSISGSGYVHWQGNNEFILTDSATVNATSGGEVFTINGALGTIRDQYMEISNNATLNILRDSEVYASAAVRLVSTRKFNMNMDSGHIVIKDEKGPSNAALFMSTISEASYKVSNGGSLDIYTSKNNSPNMQGQNVGISLLSDGVGQFSITGVGSKVRSISEDGPAFLATGNGHSNFELSNLAVLELSGSTTGGAVNSTGKLDIHFDHPLYFDIKNVNQNGRAVSTNNSTSTLIGIQSKLSLWERSRSIDGNPTFNFDTLDYEFRGHTFNTLFSTNKPEELNTSVIGTSGLSNFRRISSNNGRWAIADELRVPTNADKKIHGRVSLPEGLGGSRPAWDDEAIVTVEVESPSGETTQEYTAKTIGDSNESTGISIYGEEPRGGLFEIDLDEPLEAGSKVRISKVELTSGELTDGFEHQILTDTVEVFPIIPPRPAQFSSSIIAQDSTTIQGMTDNLDAEVTATHNGEPLNTEAVTVEADGRFTLDLSEVSLEMDDEIQVFLRDAEGSAAAAGVINPPETNSTRGNINPATELTFHDATFEPATTLIVGNLGPVSPVDPLDPEVEVEPENKPILPEEQGQLSIDFVSLFNFGSQAISVHDQTYYAKPQRLLNEDGTVNEMEERPNYVQISDRRSEKERDGWELAVTQKEQFKGEDNQVLNGASLSLSNQQAITSQGGREPSLQATIGLSLIPGNKQALLRAEGPEGTGTWIYRFGDGETAGESVALDVPRGANPEATIYSTTLIWELSAVPGN